MEPDKQLIVEKYGSMVSALAHRMIRDRETAQDAAQEVWFEVIKGLDSFQGRSGLSTWIYTIARRTISRYAKKEYGSYIQELEEFRILPLIEYEGSEEEKEKMEWVKEKCDWCLTSMNHCLTADARLIFIFRNTVGLSWKEIAAVMEMNEATVRKTGSRATKKVSDFMKQTCSLYNPSGSCKCRINKHVLSLNLDKEYASMRKVIRLVDLFQRFEKELPRKNYWLQFLS